MISFFSLFAIQFHVYNLKVLITISQDKIFLNDDQYIIFDKKSWI